MNISVLNKSANSRKQFYYGSLIIIIIFLLTRLVYYLYYPVVLLSTDSASYCAVALKILEFNPPLLDMRTPGYPMLLSLILFFSKNFIFAFVIQSVISLSASLFLFSTFCKYFRSVAIYFAIAIAIFISSTYCMVFEYSILSESFFLSILIICCSFLVLSIKENRSSYWILFSLSTAVLILIRPVALFFIPVFFFILIYFYLNKYKFNKYCSLILPLSAVIILLCTYNYYTLNKFTISPAGDLNLLACTVLYIEKSSEYPPKINAAIDTILSSIPGKEKKYIKEPNEISKLNRIYNDNFFRSWRFVGAVMKEDSSMTFMDIHPYLAKISRDAIKKHPDIYSKIIISNIYQFLKNITEELDFFDQLSISYKRVYIDNYYTDIIEDDHWEQFYSDKTSGEKVAELYNEQITLHGDFNYIKYEKSNVIFQDTFLKQVYIQFENISNYLFRNILWLMIFFLTFIYSSYKVIVTRFKDPDSFILFIFCMIYIFNVLFISALGTSISRYSYTVEFIIYLSLPFLLFQLKNLNSKKINLN